MFKVKNIKNGICHMVYFAERISGEMMFLIYQDNWVWVYAKNYEPVEEE